MREYELVLIFKPDLGEEEVPSAVERLTSLIGTEGGQVNNVDRWGKRKLAYPIQRYLEGDYVLTRFNIEPEHVESLEANLKINESLLRHLVVRMEA